MSRTRQYGQAVAIQISGPQAVEADSIENLKVQASDMLSRNFSETMRLLHHDGVSLDADTYATHIEENDDQIIMSWSITGRQTRSLIRRILRAVRA